MDHIALNAEFAAKIFVFCLFVFSHSKPGRVGQAHVNTR